MKNVLDFEMFEKTYLKEYQNNICKFNDFELIEEKSEIPERYKEMGFTKVGVKKKSNRPGKGV